MSKYQDELQQLKIERDRVVRQLFELYQSRIRELREKHRNESL